MSNKNNDINLDSYLAEKRRLVETALNLALPLPEDESRRLVEAMRYSLFLGGKRLRPILCLAGAEAVGAEAEVALPGAAALEMIHTYSLIHDDLPIMDDDDYRRGQPSNHKVFGDGLAMLAGDGLLTWGLGLIPRAAATGALDPQRAVAAQNILVEAAGHEGMVAGQAVDLASEGKDVTEEQVGYIHLHKTAALLSASTACGGILGGGDREQVDSLALYGSKLGLAFQIVDDILNIEGDETVLGKPTGSDAARGKATYPAVVGLDRSRELAAELAGEACRSLDVFGHRAGPLKAIAGRLLRRKK